MFQLKSTTTANLKSLKTACLILPIFEDAALTAAIKPIDSASGGMIKALLKSKDFTGASGKTHLLSSNPTSGIQRIILLGCGKREDFSMKTLKLAIAKSTKALTTTKATQATLLTTDLKLSGKDKEHAYRIISQTVTMQLYKFNQFKTKPDKSTAIKRFELLETKANTGKKGEKKAMQQGEAIGNGANLTRTLGNLPANICHPSYLAQEARKLAKSNPKMSCKVISENELKKMGAGAFVAVSQGSDQAGKMIILEYKNAKRKTDTPYAIVGKGITFDTGGISLKNPPKMDEMKYDMCGAATVLGVMHAISTLNLPINIVAAIAAAENMPSARATRPGDIVTTLSGKTVEILNTDAEGRLVLCDTLTYIQKYKPAAIIDMATLTGACIVALGHHASGIMGNDDDLVQELLDAGTTAEDRAWQLPLWDEYREQLDSEFADMGNIGSPGAGTVTAACFLSEFVGDYPWAHLDIAGTAWRSGGQGKAASGRPVPLLTQYLIRKSESA